MIVVVHTIIDPIVACASDIVLLLQLFFGHCIQFAFAETEMIS